MATDVKIPSISTSWEGYAGERVEEFIKEQLNSKANTSDLGDLAGLDAVSKDQISDAAVTTSKIKDGAITSDKLSSAIQQQLGWIPSTTDDLPEGITNLYFTEARAEAAVSGKADKATTLAGYGITDAVSKDADGNVNISGTLTVQGYTFPDRIDDIEEGLGSHGDQIAELGERLDNMNIPDVSGFATASALSAVDAKVSQNDRDIASLQSGKADKATTLAGYGITDAVGQANLDSLEESMTKYADGLAEDLNTGIQANYDSITALQTKVNNTYTKTEVDGKISPISTQVDTNKTNIASLQSSVEEHDERIVLVTDIANGNAGRLDAVEEQLNSLDIPDTSAFIKDGDEGIASLGIHEVTSKGNNGKVVFGDSNTSSSHPVYAVRHYSADGTLKWSLSNRESDNCPIFGADAIYVQSGSSAYKVLTAANGLTKDSNITTTGSKLTLNGHEVIDASGSTPIFYGSVTNPSDENLKKIVGDVSLTVAQIAEAPAVDFFWKADGKKDVGTIAQYWKDILPEVVHGEDGCMGVNYSTLGVVSSIVLARSVASLEQRVARLERENDELRKQLQN